MSMVKAFLLASLIFIFCGVMFVVYSNWLFPTEDPETVIRERLQRFDSVDEISVTYEVDARDAEGEGQSNKETTIVKLEDRMSVKSDIQTQEYTRTSTVYQSEDNDVYCIATSGSLDCGLDPIGQDVWDPQLKESDIDKFKSITNRGTKTILGRKCDDFMIVADPTLIGYSDPDALKDRGISVIYDVCIDTKEGFVSEMSVYFIKNSDIGRPGAKKSMIYSMTVTDVSYDVDHEEVQAPVKFVIGDLSCEEDKIDIIIVPLSSADSATMFTTVFEGLQNTDGGFELDPIQLSDLEEWKYETLVYDLEDDLGVGFHIVRVCDSPECQEEACYVGTEQVPETTTTTTLYDDAIFDDLIGNDDDDISGLDCVIYTVESACTMAGCYWEYPDCLDMPPTTMTSTTSTTTTTSTTDTTSTSSTTTTSTTTSSTTTTTQPCDGLCVASPAECTATCSGGYCASSGCSDPIGGCCCRCPTTTTTSPLGTCVDYDGGDDIYTASYAQKAWIDGNSSGKSTQLDHCIDTWGDNDILEGRCLNNEPIGVAHPCPEGYECQNVTYNEEVGGPMGACVPVSTTTTTTSTSTTTTTIPEPKIKFSQSPTPSCNSTTISYCFLNYGSANETFITFTIDVEMPFGTPPFFFEQDYPMQLPPGEQYCTSTDRGLFDPGYIQLKAAGTENNAFWSWYCGM